MKKTTPAKERSTRSRSTSNGNGNHAPEAKTARRAAAPASRGGAATVAKSKSRTEIAATSTQQRAPRAKRNGRSIRLDTEQIAVRAYFISERRRHEGRPGCATDDWVVAEQELIAEISRS